MNLLLCTPLRTKKKILSRGEIEYKVNAKLTIKNGHNKEAGDKKKQFCKIQRLQGGRNTICITGVFSHHSILCNVLYSRLNLGWQCLTFLELRPVFNLQPVSVSGWKNFAKPKTENLDDKQYMLQAYVVQSSYVVELYLYRVSRSKALFLNQFNQIKPNILSK